MTKVEVTVQGVPNELYAQNMKYRLQYDLETLWRKKLAKASYYTDKYALWLDFRTIDDNRLHGSGR